MVRKAATSKAKKLTPRRSQSSRAGLLFPVSRFHRKLREIPQAPKRISKGAGVYLSAVIEYLIAEVTELSGNACRDNKKSRISPRHLSLAIQCDDELSKFLKKVVIPGGGVVPNIYPALIPAGESAGSSKSDNVPKKPTKPRARQPVKATALDSTTKPALNKKVSGTKKASKGVTTLSERTLPTGQKLTVIQADITDVSVDAIIHPTNNTYYLGGEVGAAIQRKGGDQIRTIVNKLHTSSGNLAVGGVDISDASDTMLCKKIIHVYSPSWDTSQQDQRINDLRKCVESILTLADTNKLKTVALPNISSGGNGFPKQIAAQTILRAINSYFKSDSTSISSKSKSNIEQVILVLYDSESVGVYTSELGKLEMSSS